MAELGLIWGEVKNAIEEEIVRNERKVRERNMAGI